MSHNIVDEESGEFRQEECLVGIISREENVAYHERVIVERLCNPIETGSDLLEYVRQYLNRLVFSTEAIGQLLAMQQGYPLLQRICSIFEELQRAMQESIEDNKPFITKEFKYTLFESNTATQGKKRRETYIFF